METRARLIGMIVLGLACLASAAWGQGLSPAQYQTLKTDILVTHGADFATEIATKNYPALASWYNQLASPVVQVWRPRVEVPEIQGGIDWNIFDNLPPGK